ncbi:isoleucyl-tRNA synthetase [Phlyctema vagabunda]|uniref:isoleucine--tRNA ligase n=1 Tax=Phlyctema vagabunda TaxID=108571 RepID=A0ABR4P492_9HELO
MSDREAPEKKTTTTDENGTETMSAGATKSWVSSLRLPKSTFVVRPDWKERQLMIKECSYGLYQWQKYARSEQQPFVLNDGPPYANGPLHVGHALNKILKDIILRVKVQQGYRVEFKPGWDCHGLPIEYKALEKHRLENEETQGPLDAVGIRRAARALARTTVKSHLKELRSWALMADWSAVWTTMDKEFEQKQLEAFQTMVENGLIYRKFKPVYWSPSSTTALAESELEYKDDHVSTAAFVAFPIQGRSLGLQEQTPLIDRLSLLIWTTTPWTLPANRAVAVHNDLDYNIVGIQGQHFIVATSQLSYLQKACFSDVENMETQVIGPTFKGSVLTGTTYRNMFVGAGNENLPLIHADFVSDGSGTGLVHCAPGHGMDDYLECSKHGIEAVSPVDDLGCYTADAYPSNPEVLQGKSVLKDGGAKVLELLGANVVKVHKYKHKYPYDWRTKLPVIVRATAQWFADVGSIKEKALKHIQKVRFIPEAGRNRLETFVTQRNEWCISRQRVWGVPIPALYDEAGNPELSKESVEHIIRVIAERGIDAWFYDPISDPAWIAPHLTGVYTRGTDTMDVWFDSGTSWKSSKHQADVCLEGSDQHRGWFQSSLLTHTATANIKAAPYKMVITHGFTLDQSGRKMSKSIGNVIGPQEIIDASVSKGGKIKKRAKGPVTYIAQADPETLGPDVLRLWVASSDYTKDVVVGESVINAVIASLNKYRLTLRMLLGSMHNSARSAPVNRLDQIALVQMDDVMKEVMEAYDNYEFHKGIKAIDRWIATELSPFYLEAAKDRLYCGDGGGVIEELFEGLLRMLAPITPVLVEEAWYHRPAWWKRLADNDTHPLQQTTEDAIVPATLSPALRNRIREDTVWLMKTGRAIKAAQEHGRQAGHIGSSLQCTVVLHLPEKDMALYERYGHDILETMYVVSGVELVSAATPFKLAASVDWKYEATFSTPNGEATAIVLPPLDHKCPRCWKMAHIAIERTMVQETPNAYADVPVSKWDSVF